MRPVTIILITAALLAAGGAVVLVNRVVQHRVAEAADAREAAAREVEILVAAHDLPQGHILREADLRWNRWPTGTADPARVILRKQDETALESVAGSATRRAVLTGEPLNAAALFKPGTTNGFMPAMITPGKKAVGITVTAASTASGFVLPGDIVDVILTIDLRKAEVTLPGGGRYASETILRNVRVLAVDQALNPGAVVNPKTRRAARQPEAPAAEAAPPPPEETAVVGKTVAIEMTGEESERVLAAQAAGSLSLALRSLAYPATAEGTAPAYTRDVDMSRVLRMATGGGVKVIKGGEVAR